MKKRILTVLVLFWACRIHSAWADSAPQNIPVFSQWNYKITGEERFRYEYKHDFDFNTNIEDNGSQFHNRFRIGGSATLTDEYLKPMVEVFVEGLDAQTGGYQIKAPTNQKDDFDLHQAYVSIRNILGSDFDFKGGRQELKYGKGRLIAAPTWANRIRSFDGGVLHYQDKGVWGDVLYAQDAKYDDNNMNASRNEEFLTGYYGGYQKHKMAPLIETYVLNMTDIKGRNDVSRYTVGARYQANLGEGAVFDFEFPYQFGHTASATSSKKSIEAYAIHADITKSFEAAAWKPKVMLAYDEASGDKSTSDSVSNTFIPLYQSTHEPYGLLDFFRWQNVRNPELSATFSPNEKFRFTPQVDFFWLQNNNDAWYNSSGTVVRSKTTGDRGDYVGSEISLRTYYDFTKNLKIESGYAHFFPGEYVKDTGSSDDVDWFYSQLAYKF